MEKFFIFLDIDGTMWDKRQTYGIPYGSCEKFNQESILALNQMIDEIRKRGFAPWIVLVSPLRQYWDHCINLFDRNNIRTDVTISCLPFSEDVSKGHRISLFLRDADKGRIDVWPRPYGLLDKIHYNYASHKLNYVVIDNHFEEYTNIPKPHYIRTSMHNNCFDTTKLEKFLSDFDSKYNSEPKS